MDVMNQLTILTCSHEGCGIQFAVPELWRKARAEDHKPWYCPNGHSRWYPPDGTTELEKAQAESRRLQSQINEEQHLRLVAERERDKEVRKRRKIERRVSQGVCPCCNRTFEDLARHMKSKHKDYALPPGKPTAQITGSVQ